MDLYALIDFESSNPESYLLSVNWYDVSPKLPSATVFSTCLCCRWRLNSWICVLMTSFSSSHTVAKGVLTNPTQLHICYCHPPALPGTWRLITCAVANWVGSRYLTRYLLHQMRQWDVLTANRVDYFIANSQNTARRIWRCYRRPATVIYPPVNIELLTSKQDFYVTVSGLVSYVFNCPGFQPTQEALSGDWHWARA